MVDCREAGGLAAALLCAWQASAAPTLVYEPGATRKINQLVGDVDKERHQPTLSRTLSRYGLAGTDLGYPFEHEGRIYFLFGDTLGTQGGALDAIAAVDAAQTDPEKGVRLDFLTESSGHYLTVRPPGISMGAFEVPTAGISVNDRMYVVVDTNHTENWTTDRAVLTRVSMPVSPGGFRPLRVLSQRPDGKFLKMALRQQPGSIPGLPKGGSYVLIWGTGHYRHSDLYLSIVPVARFESGEGTLYYAGSSADGPRWDPRESAATPVLTNGTLGDVSVIWSEALKLWLMTCDSRPPAPAGILFYYAAAPWGPWSDAAVIFNARRDGLGRFIHDPDGPDDGLSGPVIGKGSANPPRVRGGNYAPYLVERWTKVQSGPSGGTVDLYYLLSTWNPYVVVLMNSRLRIE